MKLSESAKSDIAAMLAIAGLIALLGACAWFVVQAATGHRESDEVMEIFQDGGIDWIKPRHETR